MKNTTLAALVLLVFALLASSLAWAAPAPGKHGFAVTEELFDDEGRLLVERGHMKEDKNVGFVRHYTHAGNHGGGGGGVDPGTDCESNAFKATAYKWNAPYTAKAADFASQADAAGNAWDAETGADVFGSVAAGRDGTAGVRDDVNQLEWVNLGAGGTIAVTTTWYFINTGEAIESDGEYNTFYAWATNGDADAMDAQNILTHEIGHTFGLDHPKGKPAAIGCLTMYAYGSEGETQKRTLGDGDVLGIRDRYGA